MSSETVTARHRAPAEPAAGASGSAPRAVPGTGGRLVEAAWLAATMAAAALLALIPLLFSSRFYYADDTQAGAYPIWVTIGEALRDGSIPYFEPSRWMAGNLVAEGQWGTFNPLVWLIGLGASVAPDGAAYSALVKIAFLAIAAGGVFVLLRSLGADRGWSLVGGVVASTTGFTVYIDAASWVTSLFVWALLPWVLWGLRRVAVDRRNTLLAFVPGFLLITVGYVHGTLMLVVAVVGVLLETVLRRDRTGFLRAFVVSALLGLVALTVYLPGVLSSGVTARDSQTIDNSNFMSPDLSGLASSAAPTAQPWLTGFWDSPVSAPLMYISWLLPVLVLVDWRRAKELLLPLVSVLVVGAAAAALAFGPSEIGPLRFPARVLPYFSVALIVVAVLALSRFGRRPTRRLAIAASLWLVVSTYLAYAEAPNSWKVLALGSFVALLAVLGLLLTLHRTGSKVALAGVAVAATALVGVVQHQYFPISPLPDFAMPAERDAVRPVLSQTQGDVMVIGNPNRTRIGWDTTSYANGWLLSDATVTNVYSPLMHRTYAEDLCVDSHGVVCWETAGHLFSIDEATGLPLVDLLAISSLQVLARTDGGDPAAPWADPYTFADVPAGWSEVTRDEHSAVWVRDSPVQGAGDVVWASEGTDVTTVEATTTSVTLDVGAVPAGGGQVVLSRLDWPGYTVEGGELAPSVRDYLLTVTVPEDAAGGEITVSFSPPGWRAGLLALGIAVVGALGLGALDLVRQHLRPALARRRARDEDGATA